MPSGRAKATMQTSKRLSTMPNTVRLAQTASPATLDRTLRNNSRLSGMIALTASSKRKSWLCHEPSRTRAQHSAHGQVAQPQHRVEPQHDRRRQPQARQNVRMHLVAEELGGQERLQHHGHQPQPHRRDEEQDLDDGQYQSGCSRYGVIRNSDPSDDWCRVDSTIPAITRGIVIFLMARWIF